MEKPDNSIAKKENQSIKKILIPAVYGILLLMVVFTDDVAITVAFDHFRINYPMLNEFIMFTTDFFLNLLIGISVILLILSFFVKPLKKHQRWILAMNINLGITSLVTNLIKVSVKRLRPCDDPYVSTLFHVIKDSDHYSFPSGHSSSTWSVANPMMCQLKNKVLKVVFFLIGLYVPFTRVYLGVHYFSDVVVGSILGSVLWYLFAKLLKVYQTKKKQN